MRIRSPADENAVAPHLPLLGVPRTVGIQGGNRMDDKIEGKWDQSKGKVKEEAGKLGGDKSTEIGGKVDQGKGKLKEGLGEVKEDLHHEPVDR
jgi:uncharacterized protein YjbJ (UPF0337 family)